MGDDLISERKLPKDKLGQNVSRLPNSSIWHVSTSAGGNQVRNQTFISNFSSLVKKNKLIASLIPSWHLLSPFTQLPAERTGSCVYMRRDC